MSSPRTRVVVGEHGKTMHIILEPMEDWYGMTICGLFYSNDEPDDRFLWGRPMHSPADEFTTREAIGIGLPICKTCARWQHHDAR